MKMAPAKKTKVKTRKALKATPGTKKKPKSHVAATAKVTEEAEEVDEEVIEASVDGLKDNNDYKTSDDNTELEEPASTGRKQSPGKKK